MAAPVIIFSLTVHEFFHAWAANQLGDPTAKNMGRLTLNPLAHLDLFGTLMMVASSFRFGWAKPVPVNLLNLRNIRQGNLWISVAGPLSNIGLALIAGTAIRLMDGAGLIGQVRALDVFIFLMITINCSLAVFNLLPIYPLDGSHIFRSLLPERFGATLDTIERFSPYILIFLILSGWLTGVSLLWMILGPFVQALVYLVSGIGM